MAVETGVILCEHAWLRDSDRESKVMLNYFPSIAMRSRHMAERAPWFGKPLPVQIRLEIRKRRAGSTVREVASDLGVSKTTVQKYGRSTLAQNTSNAAENR